MAEQQIPEYAGGQDPNPFMRLRILFEWIEMCTNIGETTISEDTQPVNDKDSDEEKNFRKTFITDAQTKTSTFCISWRTT